MVRASAEFRPCWAGARPRRELVDEGRPVLSEVPVPAAEVPVPAIEVPVSASLDEAA